MLKKIVVLVLFFNLAFAAAVKPVFDQRQWKLGFAKQTKTDSIQEYILKADKIENWSELVTIQFFPGLQKRMDLATFANTTRKSITHICPEVTWETIANTQNESIWFFAIKDCKGQQDQSEIARVVVTNDGIHVFHYAVKQLAMSASKKQEWLKNLRAIQIS